MYWIKLALGIFRSLLKKPTHTGSGFEAWPLT